jgi:hypothetical protein
MQEPTRDRFKIKFLILDLQNQIKRRLQMDTFIISQETRRAMLAIRQIHGRASVVRQGELPLKPFYEDQWWYETIHTVPDVAKPAVDALQRARVHIKGMVIAHEAPRLLTAPKEAPNKEEDFKVQDNPILPAVEAVASIFVTILLIVFGLAFRVVLLDPALIVVLEDGTWLTVMTWYE